MLPYLFVRAALPGLLAVNLRPVQSLGRERTTLFLPEEGAYLSFFPEKSGFESSTRFLNLKEIRLKKVRLMKENLHLEPWRLRLWPQCRELLLDVEGKKGRVLCEDFISSPLQKAFFMLLQRPEAISQALAPVFYQSAQSKENLRLFLKNEPVLQTPPLPFFKTPREEEKSFVASLIQEEKGEMQIMQPYLFVFQRTEGETPRLVRIDKI